MKRSAALIVVTLAALLCTPVARAADGPNPYVGQWALTIPGGGAGWLGVTAGADGALKGEILWGGGSALPVSDVKIEGDKLIVHRISKTKPKDANAKPAEIVETLTFIASGDDLKGTTVKARDGKEMGKPAEFTGRRAAPMPPAVDLAQVKFGEPIALFNGKDLSGWSLTNPKAKNGWVVENGLLVNKAEHGGGFGNIRTDREFEDFNLVVEVNVPKDGNSGVYLRGVYECQVADTFGKALDPHNMGAIYSRITPSEAAEKPAGEWQTLDITLVKRHATVILNGKKIIDNQPVLGCTGGALWSDVTKPGPVYLQGDHTAVTYRSIVLKPVVK